MNFWQDDAQLTMDKLGIDSFDDLFLLTVQAQLLMPCLADAATDEITNHRKVQYCCSKIMPLHEIAFSFRKLVRK
jgi:hypothetical protein